MRAAALQTQGRRKRRCRGRDSPAAHGEAAVSLQPLEVHGGAEIHLQPPQVTHDGAGGCLKEVGADDPL